MNTALLEHIRRTDQPLQQTLRRDLRDELRNAS